MKRPAISRLYAVVSDAEFRAALGSSAEEMTDEQIRDANQRMGKLADALFDAYASTLGTEIVVDHSGELAVK